MIRALSLAFALALPALPPVAHAHPAAVVQGRVADQSGAGVPYAGVYLAGTTAGAAADSSGRFRFSVRKSGAHDLRARAVGYAAARRRIELVPGDTVAVRLVLREATTELEKVVVSARRGPPALENAPAMNALEAVTTPGASGDPLRAMKLLPGAQAATDGSGLFVRGGQKGETRLLLDGAPVAHPYRQETPTGGSFGTLPPFLVDGMHFSAGGFSARYGDALSGVLAMQTPGRPQETSGTAGLGLAAASVRAGAPLSGRLGARVSANRSFTGLLFRLNGQAGDFPTPPRATDGSATLVYRYGKGGDTPGGRIKAFAFAERSRLAAAEQSRSFSGVFQNGSATQLYFADWAHQAGPWRLEANFSTDRHTSALSFGALQIDEKDRAARLRLDAARQLGSRFTLTAGAEAARRTSTFCGRVPAGPGPQPPGAPTTALSGGSAPAWQGGAYAEAHARLGQQLSLRAGLRADHHTRAGSATLDPRLQLRYRVAEGTRARLAWGRYHQFPEPQQLEQAAGELESERAQHFIGGLRHDRGDWTARLEAYFKPYENLVVRTPAGGYQNAGDGRAYGLDAFARYGAFLQTRVSGWAKYSFLHAERTQLRQLGGHPESTCCAARRVLERGPTPQSATHSFTFVGEAQVTGGFYAGGTFRWATGRPVTPVVAAVPAGGESDRFLPVEGPVGSARRPAFRRLDLQLSYYWPFDDGERAATFYVSLAGALGRRNVNGYTYDDDFSERAPVHSPYRRLFYAGVTVDF